MTTPTMTASDMAALIRLLRGAKAPELAPTVLTERTGFENLGAVAFADGRERRLVPREILVDHGAEAARAWYRGWDQARTSAEYRTDRQAHPCNIIGEGCHTSLVG